MPSSPVAHSSDDTLTPASTLPARWWWGFVPYVFVAAFHVGARFAHNDDLSTPTKALLMPLLAVGVVWAWRGARYTATPVILLVAIFFSWLGDEAGLFFPFAPTLPLMLLFFGIAHLFYIWLFWKRLAVRRLPWWALVYAAWWVAMVAVMWPSLGALAIAVAAYGIVLGGTAATASRCHPIIATGGAFFLASDTILAFEIFLPDLVPPAASGAVMLTYCTGQALIAIGVVVTARGRSVKSTP